MSLTMLPKPLTNNKIIHTSRIFRCKDVIRCILHTLKYGNPYLIWIQQHWQRSAAIKGEKRIKPTTSGKTMVELNKHEMMLTRRPESWECCPPPTSNLHPGQVGKKKRCKKGNAAIYCTESRFSWITFPHGEKKQTNGHEILTGFVSGGFTAPFVSPLVPLNFMPSAAKNVWWHQRKLEFRHSQKDKKDSCCCRTEVCRSAEFLDLFIIRVIDERSEGVPMWQYTN